MNWKKGCGSNYWPHIIAGIIVVLVILFLFPPYRDPTCSNFKTSIRAMCRSKPEFECLEHATIMPGQLGHNPKDPEPLVQCIWSNDWCITNESDPRWNWADYKKDYCPNG